MGKRHTSTLSRPTAWSGKITKTLFTTKVTKNAKERSPTPSFNKLRVLTLESRRSLEMAALVSNYGGEAVSAPALREVPLESNGEALAFVDALLRDEFDLVILLT